MSKELSSKTPQRQFSVEAWNNIDSPGTYVCMTGDTLFRVQQDAVASGRSPVITTVNKENGLDGFRVAKISDNPNITITKARQLCADSDIHPNF